MCLQGHRLSRRAGRVLRPGLPPKQKSPRSDALFPGIIADSKARVNQGPERRANSSVAPTPPTPSLLPLCNQPENKLSLSFPGAATPSPVNKTAWKATGCDRQPGGVGPCSPGSPRTHPLPKSSCVSPPTPSLAESVITAGTGGYLKQRVFYHAGFPDLHQRGFGPLSFYNPGVIQLIKHPFALSLALNNWLLSIFELEGI